jgi:YD repeat-containing protein
LKKVLDTWYDLFSGKLLPKSIALLETTTPIKLSELVPYKPINGLGELYKTRLKFDYYDNGNLKLVEKVGDKPVYYQWGYNDRYPIAEIKNSELNAIYYTSFEDTGIDDRANAKTGRKYVQSGYTFQPPSDFTLATNSILSYWFYDATGWHLKKQPYVGGSVQLNDGTRIDELRIYPADAQLTTYTYDPLVGVTSSTDINNQPVQFDYDGLGRLILVKDQDKSIVKRKEYQYKKIK